MTIEKEIEGLIHKTNKDLLNENANKDSRVFPTQRDLMAGIVSKHIAKNMVPSFIMKAELSISTILIIPLLFHLLIVV